MALATYTFLPWLRRGIANKLQTPAGAGASRAAVSMSFAAASDTGRKDVPPIIVHLVGPGDITGMEARQIIRTEPRAGVSDFEPNYLAAIDFYDEDFPWRYSPLAPDTNLHRLAPWLLLAVLKDGEFTRRSLPDRPLTSFVLTAGARRGDIFPVAGQEWAFAHAHINAAVPGAATVPDLTQLGALLDANPDAGYTRLIAPRKLDPNTSYTAFLVPAFEVGRKAGLGEPVADTDDGTARAWDGAAEEFPIYFEWSFRTGVAGDFESLVRALVPRDMDPRVGIRDMDVAHPGFGIDQAHNPPDDLVGLEGALLAPTTVRKGLAAGSDFAAQAQAVLNAPAAARADGDADPLVAPPIYGCWHAQVDRVTAGLDNPDWVNGLNLDPRYRAGAGLGARVIRANQEKYVRAAWEQIGDVISVNHKIRRAQLAGKAAAAQYAKSFATLPLESALAVAAPVFPKVLGSPTTLAAMVKSSRLPRASVSPALRRQTRARGRLVKRLIVPATRAAAMTELVNGLNAGRLSAAPPRPAAGGATLEDTNDTVAAAGAGGATGRLLLLLLLIALAVVALLLGLLAAAAIVAIAAAAAAVLIARAAGQADTTTAAGASRLLSMAGLSPAELAVERSSPSYAFAGASTDATLPPAAPAPVPPVVAGDNPAAADMRRALVTFGGALTRTVALPPPKAALDVAQVHQRTLAALEPQRAIAARFAPLFRVGAVDAITFAATRYPVRHPPRNPDALQEVMNYPDIKDAMYAPLGDISSEYFLPNLRLVPNNTISLLKPNQTFIESYLVGLNHEFARELLWREYPTDQRGSYFRQFWDVAGFVDTQGRDAKMLSEDLKDIPPIHQWLAASALGTHDKRQTQGDQVVLVIRGDLLKRYPNTFIYAQKAVWGTGERANRLVLADETGEVFATTPNDPRLRFPLYRARIAPDVHFVGFDLSLDEARGDPRLDETAAARAVVGDNLGWFFVLQEAVGEPRFGLDVDAPIEPSPDMWDNLAWVNVDLSAGQAIDLAKPFVSAPAGANPQGVNWGANAADMAFIFYQDPVLVAVHGRNMLKNLNPVS
jgi:hypothetical protein